MIARSAGFCARLKLVGVSLQGRRYASPVRQGTIAVVEVFGIKKKKKKKKKKKRQQKRKKKKKTKKKKKRGEKKQTKGLKEHRRVMILRWLLPFHSVQYSTGS